MVKEISAQFQMKRIYISGCGGMLGEAFYSLLNEVYKLKCTDIDLNDSWLSYCDVRDFGAYRKDVFGFSPDVLIHLAALTDLEYCEDNQLQAYETNTLAVENAVHIANELNVPLVYISTAGIFSGERYSYDDWDAPEPINTYGRSKYAGERFVVENCDKYLVCRAGWMMGGGRKDKKFVSKILKQLQQDEILAVNDKDGTPTYTYDFVRNLMFVLNSEKWGIYNIVCEGEASRYDVAEEIIKLTGSKAALSAVNSYHFKNEYYAPRPASERLVCTKLRLRGLYLMRDWKVCLREYINQMK